MVLLFFTAVFLSGTILDVLFKRYAHLRDIVNVMDTETIYPKLDINQATYEQFLKVPYIGPVTAKTIIDYRKDVGRFESVDQLISVPGLNEKRLRRIRPYLRITMP